MLRWKPLTDRASSVSDPEKTRPVLVIGATGYIGGRLVPKLLELGYTVRVMGRSLSKLESRPWATHPRLEAVQGDVLDANSLKTAVRGCWAAFYLDHSMNASRGDFAYLDRLAAWNMAGASGRSTFKRIIYLGGVGGRERPKAQQAPPLAARGGQDFALRSRPRHNVAGRDDPRVGERLVRNSALPRRSAPGHARAALGAHTRPAHLHPKRAQLPCGLPRI